MQDQFKNFIQVLKALNKHEVDYILIGGVAVILHGMERLTRDIDIFVKLNKKNIKKLRTALRSVFKDSSIEEITLDELKKYQVIRYGTPDDFNIDIMIRLGEDIVYENLESEIIEYENIKIKICTVKALYDLKKNTLRPKDQIDVMFLKRLIDEIE